MNANADLSTRKILSDVALGRTAPDTIIKNGRLFNVFTREFIDRQSIWIKQGMIACVGSDSGSADSGGTRVIDADGMVLLPGLIEGHTHILSSRYSIEEFVRYAIPSGLTTAITEAAEYLVVAGKDGLDYVLGGVKNQPIRIYCTLPPLCGLTPSEEIHALENADILSFLEDPSCLGIGEIYWGNLLLEGHQGERCRELAALALERGKTVEGHTAGASGKKLQAYSCFGISSCHEPITEEDVLERLRLGYWVMIREGYVRKELEGVKGIFKKEIDFRRLSLVTDGVDPAGFLEEGSLDAALRRAMKLGAPPDLAYQMVTLNAAEHFHLDHLIGSLSPGKMADIVISPSPEDFEPQLVMCNGKVLFENGKRLAEPEKIYFPERMFKTVQTGNYRLPYLPDKGKARAMHLVTRLVTQEKIVDLDAPPDAGDLNMIFALDRLGSGHSFMGYLKGFGLREGAYGTTMAWDTRDLIVVGCDYVSMSTVIDRLREIGGGGVFASGKETVAEFPAPICGISSTKPMKTIRDETRRLDDALRQRGVPWETPILTVDTLGTGAIPHFRINHNGYVRLKDRKVLPVSI
jgi:adenine deaminase